MSISMASRKGAAGPRLRRPASLRSSGIRRSARRRARSTPRSAGWTTSSRTSTCSWSSAAAWTASSPRQSFRASAGAGGREGRPVRRDTTPRLPAEHDNTGDATVQVLHGREYMHSGGDPLGGAAWDLCAFRKRRTAWRPLRTRLLLAVTKPVARHVNPGMCRPAAGSPCGTAVRLVASDGSRTGRRTLLDRASTGHRRGVRGTRPGRR